MPNNGIIEILRIEALTARLEKAKQIVADGGVSRDPDNPQQYRVESQARPGAYYIVTDQCECKDASIKGQIIGALCKHVLSVILFKAGDRNGET